MQSAAKVGALVVLFVGLLIGAYAFLRVSLFATPSTTYYADFADAGGLSPGARVLLSGVEVGRVTKVELVEAGRARATLQVDRAVAIPEGSVAVLPTSFIGIGDRQVELTPPTGAVGRVAAGSVIPGSLKQPLDSVFPNAGETIDKLNETLAAVQGLLQDPELSGGVKRMIGASEVTIKEFGQLARRMDGFIATNQGQVRQLMVTTGRSLENLYAVTEEVKKLVESGELQGKATALLDNLNDAVVQGKKLVADLNTMVADPELRASIRGTLDNVKVMSESGTRIAADAEVMARNGVTVSEEATKLMAKANDLALQVEGLIQRFNEAVDRFVQPGGRILPEGIEAEASLTRETSPGRFRADVNVTVPIGREKLVFGLYDAFEHNRINAQLVRPSGQNLDLRYGVYAAKPGFGVDYRVAPGLTLRGDVFGLNNPQFDARLQYDLGNGVRAWAGVERIFRDNAPAAGIGVRR